MKKTLLTLLAALGLCVGQSAQAQTTPLLVEGKIVGMAFSKAAAKELLSRQLAQQLAKDPSQLGRLITSLQEDPVEVSGL